MQFFAQSALATATNVAKQAHLVDKTERRADEIMTTVQRRFIERILQEELK